MNQSCLTSKRVTQRPVARAPYRLASTDPSPSLSTPHAEFLALLHMHIHTWDLTHLYVWRGTFTGEIWLILMIDLTCLCMWFDLFMYVIWPLFDPSICATRLIHLSNLAHSHVRHDSFTCETWLILMWDMTHSHVRHDSFTCATWLVYTWAIDDTTQCATNIAVSVTWCFTPHTWHHAIMYLTWLILTFDSGDAGLAQIEQLDQWPRLCTRVVRL